MGTRAALQEAKQLVTKREAQEARPPGANGWSSEGVPDANGWSSARAPDQAWAACEGAVPAKATTAA